MSIASTLEKDHVKYIETHVIAQLMKHFDNESFKHAHTEPASGLDGFMSALYMMRMHTMQKNGEEKVRSFFIKFMKGDVDFRNSSKSYIQFANEVHAYGDILSSFQRFLDSNKVKEIHVHNWSPAIYKAEYGYIEGLSKNEDQKEAVIILEDLKVKEYNAGPRVFLSKEQLTAMTIALGQYHAISYAMKAATPTEFERLKNGIIPLPFIYEEPDEEKNNLYRVLYRVAFDRFYGFFDSEIIGNSNQNSVKISGNLIETLHRLRLKYFDEPTKILEKIRTDIENCEDDKLFGTILHGDYNRNNVLFRANPADKRKLDVKMIDFQEMRYGTLAIDLSFFMYFNMSESEREQSWDSLLKLYHQTVVDSMRKILERNHKKEELNKILEHYSFDKFMKHFSRYAVYGVLICMHFWPWVLCNEDECGRLSSLFENDLHSKEFYELSITAGGHDVDYKILNVIKHAHGKGYMDYILS